LHQQLNGVLAEEARAGHKFVVVIDEAQKLSDAALETVRSLTNFETPQTKLMQVVLSGQTQLAAKLITPSLVQLRQRISTVCLLEPFSTRETAADIEHRLKLVGYDGAPLFTEDALKLLIDASKGTPRVINTLRFNALSPCCALKSKQVDGSMVAEVLADQQLIRQSAKIFTTAIDMVADPPREPELRRSTAWPATLFVATAAVLVIVSLLSLLKRSRPRRTADVPASQIKLCPRRSLRQMWGTAAKPMLPRSLRRRRQLKS
jgi:hypothetical protein